MIYNVIRKKVCDVRTKGQTPAPYLPLYLPTGLLTLLSLPPSSPSSPVIKPCSGKDSKSLNLQPDSFKKKQQDQWYSEGFCSLSPL